MSEVDSVSLDYGYNVTDSDFSFEGDFDSGSDNFEYQSDEGSVEAATGQKWEPAEEIIVRNRVRYRPWRLSEFIQLSFLDKIEVLKNMQLPLCDGDDLLIMLHFKNWQSEDVINEYYDDWKAFRVACGLPEAKFKSNKIEILENFYCHICCDTYESAKVYSLSCDHKYCIDCYSNLVVTKVTDGSLIRCMMPECLLTIPHRDVQLLANNVFCRRSPLQSDCHDIGDLSHNLLLVQAAKQHIERNKAKWKWCPAPDCENVTELLSRTQSQTFNNQGEDLDIFDVPIVTCLDSHEFCFDCQYENHLPCPCWLVKMWIKKCSDDSETSNWMQANTQSCPQCFTLIEKSGGCNHMICSKCKYEFCWICLKSWSGHGASYYVCNRFDPDDLSTIKKQQQLKKLSLQRYLHFYKRFSVHESSMQGDKKIIKKVEDKMKQYMEEELKKVHGSEDSLSWIDVEFLRDGIKALTNGRKTLKWTYCIAFYLNKTNFSEIFEQMQDYLSKTVEDLSLIFEQINDKKSKSQNKVPIIKNKPEIVNLANVVAKRQKLLIECAYSGLRQGLLVIETD